MLLKALRDILPPLLRRNGLATKELALLVEVAAVSPLPTRSQCTPKSYCFFGDPVEARGGPDWDSCAES